MMITRWWPVLLLVHLTPGRSYGDSEMRSVAGLLWASVRNTTTAAADSPPRRLEEQAKHRRLWAHGTGALDEQAAVADLLAAGPEAVGLGRRRGSGGGGRAGGGGNKRVAPLSKVTTAAVEAEEQSGNMPRWKQDMLKNKTGTAWRKWLDGQGKEAALGLKDPAYGGRNTDAARSSSSSSSSSSSGDYWKECGGMPKTSQVMKHAPNLGALPK